MTQANIVEDHIVLLVTLREIFFCVIDHVAGAERFHKIDIARAANTGNFGAHVFCDLNRKRANAARSAIDQNFLAGLNLSVIAKSLQGGDAGDIDRRSFFERDICRL